MITRIGIIAGEIWQLLENGGNRESISVKDINSRLDRSKLLILMSLGWLSREGHILMEGKGEDLTVTLREKNTEAAKR